MLQVGFVAETTRLTESLVVAGYTATYEAKVLAILDYVCNVDQSRLAASHLRSCILTGVTTPGMFRRKGLEGED
jgi:hypothetical protein